MPFNSSKNKIGCIVKVKSEKNSLDLNLWSDTKATFLTLQSC